MKLTNAPSKGHGRLGFRWWHRILLYLPGPRSRRGFVKVRPCIPSLVIQTDVSCDFHSDLKAGETDEIHSGAARAKAQEAADDQAHPHTA